MEILVKDISQARRVLNQWLIWFRDAMCVKVGHITRELDQSAVTCADQYSLVKIIKIIRSIYQTDRLLANPSMNHKLAMEVLMLEI